MAGEWIRQDAVADSSGSKTSFGIPCVCNLSPGERLGFLKVVNRDHCRALLLFSSNRMGKHLLKTPTQPEKSTTRFTF